MSTLSPDQINEKHGRVAYRCRVCHAESGLQWFNDTSCPVCSKPGCIKELWREWDEALASNGGEEE